MLQNILYQMQLKNIYKKILIDVIISSRINKNFDGLYKKITDNGDFNGKYVS